MAGPVVHRASRLSRYSGMPMASLRLLAVAVLALAGGGCAVSSHLGTMFSGSSPDRARAYAGEGVTGSIARGQAAVPAPQALPSESDLNYARAAIVEMLTRGDRETSVPWENPGSGAHGTVTPIATAYALDGATCHGFLASHVRDKVETWMEGEACRQKRGLWEVKSLRPWKRS